MTTYTQGQLAQVYVERDGDGRGHSGQGNYTLADPHTSAFQIRYSMIDDKTATSDIYLENIHTLDTSEHNTISVGFTHNIATPLILSGTENDLESLDIHSNWMEQNLPYLGCHALNQICMPGSHDAGMSKLDGKTTGASRTNTVTQNLDIAGQLRWGIRYFDIRPVIAAAHFKTGHYSKVKGFMQGGNGQSIDEIITQVNDFTGNNRELVILHLTHSMDTDAGDRNYPPLSQDQWNRLLDQLSSLKHLYAAPPGTDYSRLKLNDVLKTSAAVFVIVDSALPDGSEVVLGSHEGTGFIHGRQYDIYNNYADTGNQDKMVSDQLAKLKQQRTSPDSGLFLLSWTLTTGATTSIIDKAQDVYPRMFQSQSVWDACSTNTYPNIIMIDAVSTDQRLTAFTIAINRYFAPKCS